jgi:hypothetical protein
MPLTSVFFFGVVAVWVGAALRLARTMAPAEREIVTQVIRGDIGSSRGFCSGSSRGRGAACAHQNV